MGCGGGFGDLFRSRERYAPQEKSATESPLDVLKIRLAKGEITLDEYTKLAEIFKDAAPARGGQNDYAERGRYREHGHHWGGC